MEPVGVGAMMPFFVQRLAVTGLCVAVMGGACSSAATSNPGPSPVDSGQRGSGGAGGTEGAGGAGIPSYSDGAVTPPTGGIDAAAGPPSGVVADAGMGRGPAGRDAGTADSGAPVAVPPGAYTGQIAILQGVVPPVIAPDCPGDPTAGWTEYSDTFQVEHPFDLPVADRFSIASGIYTFWVMSNDKPHVAGNTTAPRTEARWSNFTNTSMHMWAADVLLDTPLDHTTIMQVHTTATGAGPVYLRVDGGAIHPLNGPNFVTGLMDKWFNLKVAFDPMTLSTTIWVNNCQKVQRVIGPRGDSVFYFKNGSYTCPGTICRDHYKNFHLYQK